MVVAAAWGDDVVHFISLQMVLTDGTAALGVISVDEVVAGAIEESSDSDRLSESLVASAGQEGVAVELPNGILFLILCRSPSC